MVCINSIKEKYVIERLNVALILRNGGSQSPDRWLRELRNNQIDVLCGDEGKKTSIKLDEIVIYWER